MSSSTPALRVLLSFYFVFSVLLIAPDSKPIGIAQPITKATFVARTARHKLPVAIKDELSPPAENKSPAVTDVAVSHDRDPNSLQRATAQEPTGLSLPERNVHQYFIPFDDQELIQLLRASNACQGRQAFEPVGDILASRISITASSDDTFYFYDHWEDGYDAEPQNPGPTTVIGGLKAGRTRIFEDDVNTADPDWGTTLYYDGRDRITIFGDPASVIRGASPSLIDSPIGTRLAGAWEVSEADDWGAGYIVPTGEDWGAGSDFEFTGASATVLRDGTQIYLNGNPVRAEPFMIGDTWFRNGTSPLGPAGLDSGDTITATGPIEIHLYSSICTFSNWWSGNGYTLEPLGHWTSDYWSPVPRRTAGPTCSNSADTDIFLFNDTGVPFDITIDDGTPTTVALPPGSNSVAALNGGALSNTQGTHIFAPGGEPFWGVVNIDTRNIRFEWGYSLVPADELSSQVVLGWAPGNAFPPPLAQYPPNGNLAFVIAITDTVIFADLDQDGNPDPIDCNGDGDAEDLGVDGFCDEPTANTGVPVIQGQTLRVADPVDANLTGALIFTQDLTEKIAVAWGQDSCVAEGPLPYIDMGYTVLPIPIPSLAKFDDLAQDVDGSGDISAGDILTYTVIIANNGQGPMSNVVMTDRLPYTYTDFIVGSIASISSPPPLPAPGESFFDGTSWGYVPAGSEPFNTDPAVQQLRLTWPRLEARQRVTVTFHVQIDPDLPPDVKEISNLVLVSNLETRDSKRESTATVGQPILWLDKLPSEPTTVRPGGLLTYTIVVSNVGTATAVEALTTDDLPPWLTYITDTLDLTWPTAHVITSIVPISQVTDLFTGSYGDDFDLADHSAGTTGFAGSDGTLPWLGDWNEINDDGAFGSGDISVLVNGAAANSPFSYLQIIDSDGNDSGLRRCADLSDFVEPHLNYRVGGDIDNTQIDDNYRVVITSTASTITFTDRFNALPYESRDLDLSDLAEDSAVCIIVFAEAGLDAIDQYRIDDVFIYDAFPEHEDSFELVRETTVISYTTRRGINPVTYTRIPPNPFTPAITHTMTFTNAFPFPPQSRFTATFQMQAGYPLTDGLQMVNTACVTTTNLITKPYPLCDPVTTTIQSDHVLTITKSREQDLSCFGPGQLLTYNLFWEASGDEPAPGVVVTDSLPLPYVGFVSCAGGLSCGETPSAGSGVVVWNLGDRLPPLSGITNDSGWLTLTVRLEQRPPNGTFTNTVIIDDRTDTPPDEDDERTVMPEASFDLSKRRVLPISHTAKLSDTIVFRINITNTGLLTITHLPLEDTFDPVYLQYESAVPPPDTILSGRLVWNDLTAGRSPLAPGETVAVTVTYQAIAVTVDLPNGETINRAVSDGAETEEGPLCRLEDEDFAVIAIETAIELLYFHANPKAGGVLVEWATLFEIDTYGFWLYRGDDPQFGHAVSVAFVPSEGGVGRGATYHYMDADLNPGAYYYWLVEVENSGQEATYGPVSARSGWDAADLPYRIYLPLIR